MGLYDNLTYAFGSEPGANTNLDLRRRIALSMLSQKKGFPKNLGEGLTAIGDAIGDRGLMSRVEREDAQAQAAARALGAGFIPSGGSPSTNAAPVVNEGTDTVAEVPRALTPVEPNQPSEMLSEDSRMPGLNTPQQPASMLSPQSTLGGTAPRLASGSFTPPSDPAPPAADAGYNSLDAAAGVPPPNAPVMASDAPPIGAQASAQRDAIARAMPGSTPATLGAPAPDPRLAQSMPSYRPGPLPAPAVARPAQPSVPPAQAAARQEGRPVIPTAPTPVPMSRDEARLEQLKLENAGNPYAAPQIDRMLGPIKAAREAENARRVEEYKAKLQHYNQLDLDYVQNSDKRRRDETLAPAVLTKAQADARKAVSDALAGAHTTVEGRLMIPDPNKPMGSPWIDVTAPRKGATGDGPPVAAKPLTEHQDKTQKFLTQMILGEKQLEGKEKILATSPLSDVANAFGGNALLNRNYKIARGAADFSVAANLRDISGAVIGETEQVRQYKMNMPKLGDSDNEIAAKRERRKAIMDSMYGGLGEDGRALVDYSKKKMHERHDEVQRKINEEMSHLKNKPKGYRATKGGMARVWDGKNWLDD